MYKLTWKILIEAEVVVLSVSGLTIVMGRTLLSLRIIGRRNTSGLTHFRSSGTDANERIPGSQHMGCLEPRESVRESVFGSKSTRNGELHFRVGNGRRVYLKEARYEET